MGKLIIIEGGDGSGKATQTKRLHSYLENAGFNVRKVSFPNYESPSSSMIKMYLSGDFGEKADDVNPYVASTFYTVDRFASYKTDWKGFYESDGIVLSDRYTTSNMVHQAIKIKDLNQRKAYLNWLTEFEFQTFGLPKPDLVIFLDMPPEFSLKLMEDRNNKFTGEAEKDIHENDTEHIRDAYHNAKQIAKDYGWCQVPCTENDRIKSVDEIHKLVVDQVKKLLEK